MLPNIMTVCLCRKEKFVGMLNNQILNMKIAFLIVL